MAKSLEERFWDKVEKTETCSMNISDEAVEAAARKLYQREGLNAWEKQDESVRTHYRRKVHVALEAAAPHMLADLTAHLDHAERLCESNATGKEFAVVSVQDLRQILNQEPQRSRPANPYRSQADPGWADHLIDEMD